MKSLAEDTKNWFIAYSPYVDTLHVYHDSYNKKTDNELLNKDFGDFAVVYDSHTLRPLLFEMKIASRNFGDIDNMSKRHIIQSVKGYIDNYGR